MSHFPASSGVRRLCQVGLGVMLTGIWVGAQPTKLAPKEIAQIVDAAMQAVIPPDSSLGLTVRERGVRFDFARTMAAFGHGVDASASSSLALRSAVTPGSQTLLNDCDQSGSKPCTLLGNSVYVFLEPSLITNSEAVVWLHVTYSTRFAATTTRAMRVYTGGSSMQVFLARSGPGPWRFVRVGGGIKS